MPCACSAWPLAVVLRHPRPPRQRPCHQCVQTDSQSTLASSSSFAEAGATLQGPAHSHRVWHGPRLIVYALDASLPLLRYPRVVVREQVTAQRRQHGCGDCPSHQRPLHAPAILHAQQQLVKQVQAISETANGRGMNEGTIEVETNICWARGGLRPLAYNTRPRRTRSFPKTCSNSFVPHSQLPSL